MPVVGNWYTAAVRGLLAMAPPPPPLGPPYFPCPGLTTAPGPVPTDVKCGPCVYDATKLCAFVDDPFNPGTPIARPLPLNDRGFDDPQADPDLTLVPIPGQTFYFSYTRADTYDLTPYPGFPIFINDPPWGSQPLTNDCDADGLADPVNPCVDRHNQGAFSAYYDFDVPQDQQQLPGDAWADPSCGADSDFPCSVYTQDCGGYAHFGPFTPIHGSPLPGAAPAGYNPYPSGPLFYPPSPPDWPVIPFPRDWAPYATSDADTSKSIARLLRFTTSIVQYDSTQPHMNEYSLAEDARSVMPSAPGTPIAGLLFDAYNYFKNTVFKLDSTSASPDPQIACRDYRIIYITDGIEECKGMACSGAGLEPGNANGGPSKDLGLIKLPGGAARIAAHALDPTVPLDAIPVYVIALVPPIPDPTLNPQFKCIADNSSSVTDPSRKGRVFVATDRQSLLDAISSVIPYTREARAIAAPAVPAFSGSIGANTAQIGSVIPSHTNLDKTASQWSIWEGALKSFRLASDGTIPTVLPPTQTPGGPTPTNTPAGPTPTPTVYPDESAPNAAAAKDRRPVWDAARVLGYTGANQTLAENQAPVGPYVNAPEITTWPGRKMVWARGTGSAVPLDRSEFVPNVVGCNGGGSSPSCFDDLINAMGSRLAGPPASTTAARILEATRTVEFLRGTTWGLIPRDPPGAIPHTHDRDQILNEVRGAAVSPYIGRRQGIDVEQFSYFFQDNCPAPDTQLDSSGNPDPSAPCVGPQVRPDDNGNGIPDSNDGYPHKLGDIFHSEPFLLEPPRLFPFLAANLTPRGSTCAYGSVTPLPDCSYGAFAALHSKRRRVVFVGANDGFLHAFDAGVWNRDTVNFKDGFDLGTGRELFAYTPRGAFRNNKFPTLINLPPRVQYFVDGAMGFGDVFIDPSATPDNNKRTWKTVLVGSLRQGGNQVFALDVTQPDQVNAAGDKTPGALDSSPDCLDNAGSACAARYPNVLWEVTDDCASGVDPAHCVVTQPIPKMGETWSRPVVGRISILNSGISEDRYVAFFGGGWDNTSTDLPKAIVPTDDPILCPPTCSTRGRAFYMVDIETGKILYKVSQGNDKLDVNGNPIGNNIDFASMAAAPTAVDYSDAGYIQVVYMGDVNGRLWRIDVTSSATATPKRGDLVSGMLTGYQPFLLYDGWCTAYSDADHCSLPATQYIQPIFIQPSAIFLSGGNPPVFGVAFGTGDRAELTRSTPAGTFQRFHFVVDNQVKATLHERDLRSLNPSDSPTPGPGPGPYTLGCLNNPLGPCSGFYLDFASSAERTTSSVFSTQGFLSLITFAPSKGICGTEGFSYRYRFFFLGGQGGYNITTPTGTYADYVERLGTGLASGSQTSNGLGDTLDTTLFSGGNINQHNTPGSLRRNSANWKEVNNP